MIVIVFYFYHNVSTCLNNTFYCNFSNMLSCVTVFYNLSSWLIIYGNVIKIGYYCECQDMYGGFPWNNGWLDNGRADAAGDGAARACYCIHIRYQRYIRYNAQGSTLLIIERNSPRLRLSTIKMRTQHFYTARDNRTQSRRIHLEVLL